MNLNEIKFKMKRQRKHGGNPESIENDFYMHNINQPKFESTIEAQVQDGETLQALALRFHCTVSEIKRINKIDKDNEIYARKTIKIPLTPHSVLAEILPDIHKSGQSSPKQKPESNNELNLNNTVNLNEKLIIASVNSSEIMTTKNNNIEQNGDYINTVILNSRLKSHNEYGTIDNSDGEEDKIIYDSFNEPLLSGVIDESVPHPRPIPIPVPSKGIFDCSGSDCDISWICLFIFILALCFAIPLIYVLYIAEHPEKFHHNKN